LNTRTDAELVQRAKEGDASAFELLYARHHARIYRLLYGMLGNHDDAAELTQEVFVRVWVELPRLQIEKNALWLAASHRHQSGHRPSPAQSPHPVPVA
jgi:RNA polymerase sigma-70 factor (ECF subfamily)